MKNFQQKQDQPEPRGDVEEGDEIYVHHQGQPCTGRVVCHGRHGVTVEVSGQPHKVLWDKFLGHKKRAPLQFDVLEHGEDGMLVQDKKGRRRFIAVPPEAREMGELAKALNDAGQHQGIKMVRNEREIVLFFKAQPAAAAPKQDAKPDGEADQWAERAPGAGAAQAGKHVAFRNGEHRGHGAVKAVGDSGVTVADKAGGEHRVLHDQITHEWTGEGEPNEEPPEDETSDDQVIGEYDGKVSLPGEVVTKLLETAPRELRAEVAQFLREQNAGAEVDESVEKTTTKKDDDGKADA